MSRNPAELEQTPVEQPPQLDSNQARALDFASIVGTGDFRNALAAMQGPVAENLLKPLQIGGGGNGGAGGDGAAGPADNGVANPRPEAPARVQAPLGFENHPQPQINAPELQGMRNDVMGTQNDGNTVVRSYTNADGSQRYQITQHLRGPLAGAEILQDGNGRVIRQREAESSQGPGRPRLEIEYTYGPPQPGQQHLPTGLVMRNSQTGEELGRRAGEHGSILPHPDGCTIRNGDVTESMNINGSHATENARTGEGSMQFVPQADIRTPNGVLFPRGSLVTHTTGKMGERYTTVTSADGQSNQHFRQDQDGNLIQTGESFARPRTVQWTVNGTNHSFENITEQHLGANGDLHMRREGQIITLQNRNGLFVNIDKQQNDKPTAGFWVPPPILFNGPRGNRN